MSWPVTQVNPNGLTFDEWLAAATFGASELPRSTIRSDAARMRTYRAAWWRGEDPTDHAPRGRT